MGLRYINWYNFKCPIVQYVQYTLYIPQFSEIKQQKLSQNMMIEYTVPGIAPPEWSYLLLSPHVPHQEGQPAWPAHAALDALTVEPLNRRSQPRALLEILVLELVSKKYFSDFKKTFS